MPATKQQIRQIIADNNLNSVADVYSLLRESFKDILQELMEAELDATLGYEKNQKGEGLVSTTPVTSKTDRGLKGDDIVTFEDNNIFLRGFDYGDK